MDPCFACAVLILVILIYWIVPWNREEYFTDAVSVTPTCPSGGKLDNKKCVDHQAQTCDCPMGTTMNTLDNVCCMNETCKRWRQPNCSCPNNYRMAN